MSKKSVIVISLLVVALAGVLVWTLLTTNKLNETQSELFATRAQLAATATELEQIKGQLADTETELVSTQSNLENAKTQLTITEGNLVSTTQQLNSTKSELASTRIELTSAKSNLISATNELESTQQALNKAQDTLSSTQQQLALAAETLEGLGIEISASSECYDAVLVDNPQAQDPSWQQLMTFLSQDKTDTHQYILSVYDCSEFSQDFHNNAEAAGIRAAEVLISFKGEVTGHALNAFLTTDYGLVYVDCTEQDTVARIVTGKTYRAVEPSPVSKEYIRDDQWWDGLWEYYYISSLWGGQVVTSDIIIYW